MVKKEKKLRGSVAEFVDVVPNDPAMHEVMAIQEETKGQVPAMRGNEATELMAEAIRSKTPVDVMERLMTIRRELRAEYAEEQFNAAMAKFQSECPVIEKRKSVKDDKGKLLYKYAPLDDIVEQAKGPIANNGFSYSWDTLEDANTITAVCTVTHIQGHSKSSRFNIPSKGGTSIMSGPQKAAAALTFGKRYAFCNAFGIMTGDEDVDAAKNVVEPPQPPEKKPAAPPQPPASVSVEQTSVIRNLFSVLDVDAEKQRAWLTKTQKRFFIEDLTWEEASNVIVALNAKITKVNEDKTAAPVNENAQPVAPMNTGDVTMEEIAAVMPPQQQETLNSRAMNCKTQEDARDIIGMATLDKDTSPVRITAIKGILSAKGFTV